MMAELRVAGLTSLRVWSLRYMLTRSDSSCKRSSAFFM